MSDSTGYAFPRPEDSPIRHPPHYTSGRFSASDLSHDFYSRALEYGNDYDTEPRRAKSSTPRRRTPPLPSSAFSEDRVSCSPPASTILADNTDLTIPPADDEDEYGVVTGVAIPDPFRATDECEHDYLHTHQKAMDVRREDLTAEIVVMEEDQPNGTAARSSHRVRSFLGLRKLASKGPASPAVTHVRALAVGSRRSSLEVQLGQGGGNALQAADAASGTRGEERAAENGAPDGGEGIAWEEGGDGDSVHNDPMKVDPDYETNSNWDLHDRVQKNLQEYEEFKSSIKGHENWTEEQAHLHKLIALRGSWPMLSRDWAFNFRTRNIYPWVYAPEKSNKQVAINSRTNEFRAAKALEALFDLSALICSYRQIRMESRIGPVLHKNLKRHIDWAMYDAGLTDREYIPTLEVYQFDPADYADQPEKSGSDSDVDSDPISDEVDRRLRALAAKHRRNLVLPTHQHLPEEQWKYASPPPLLFAFVILQHMVMIINLDPSHPTNEIIVFVEVDMSEADQWLWNALAITLPVHAARDALWEVRETLPVKEKVEAVDPDL